MAGPENPQSLRKLKFLQIHEKFSQRQSWESHKFSGHQQTRIYSELTNFSIHHSKTWSTFPHHTRSRFSDNISFSWPYSLVPYFSTSPDTQKSRQKQRHTRKERRFWDQMWNVMQLFFLLSVGEMGRHFDIKFVFLVKWLEASRAALGRCQI